MKATKLWIVVALAGVGYYGQAFCPVGTINSRTISRTRLLQQPPPCGRAYLSLDRHNMLQRAFQAFPDQKSRAYGKNWRRRTAVAALASFLALAGASLPAAAAVVVKNSPSRVLGAYNVAAAAAMLTGLSVLPLAFFFGASNMARRLVVSASRCALQVYLLGSIVLNQMLGVNNPLLVAAWIAGVGFVAGQEAFSRIQYTYPEMRRHVYTSVWAGGWTVLALSLGLGVLGRMEPWFQPRTWIPVAGMLFGNTLSATALGASTITKDFATQQDSVELRLARGATWREAVSPLLLDTLSTALTPTINGLAVTGVVHIPGMMTGQILAGQSVSQAALYQIMINFLITATACTTVQLLMRAAVGALVDAKYHRLRQGVLSSSKPTEHKWIHHHQERKSLQTLWREMFQPKAERQGSGVLQGSTIPVMLQTASPTPLVEEGSSLSSSSNRKRGAIVLKAEALVVPRAMACVSFSLRPGDRIGITGRSGAGKSQVLHSIAGLEESPAGTLKLKGVSLEDMDLPEYRTKVCLVPQRIPIMQGTPRQLYDEILCFGRQKKRISGVANLKSPMEIAKKWGINERLFEQDWPTLSGGEAQRISLAIALSLGPEVLLLDESLSAVDEATTRAVEETLLESNVPIVMVTHSSKQLNRFCTHQIDLTPTANNDPVVVPLDEKWQSRLKRLFTRHESQVQGAS